MATPTGRPARLLLSLALSIALAAFCAFPVLAAQPAPAPGKKQAPAASDAAAEGDDAGRLLALKAAMKADATPLDIRHEGNDTLGAKLTTALRETVNTGTLFALSDKDAPKLLLHITTRAEFPSRPGVGSLYTVVWVYYERASVLSSYLAHEVGVVTPETVGDVAAEIAARSAGIAAKHSYVFGR